MGIPNYLMALANHEGPAIIHVKTAMLPVKIMDIDHEYDPTRGIDRCEFKCQVVNQDQIMTFTPTVDEDVERYVKNHLNSMYGARPDNYAKRDVRNTIAGAKALREAMQKSVNPFEIRKVIFNEPATIVFWADGTKTVVKCQEGDVYSKETGLALCFAKKALGNKGNFNDIFHEWIPEEKKSKKVETTKDISALAEAAYGTPSAVEVDEDE